MWRSTHRRLGTIGASTGIFRENSGRTDYIRCLAECIFFRLRRPELHIEPRDLGWWRQAMPDQKFPVADGDRCVARCRLTPVQRVELTTYTTAYSDGLEATNGVLDIIVPYERVVMRLASGDTASLVSTPRAAGASPPPIEGRRSPARPLPPPDPSCSPIRTRCVQPSRGRRPILPCSPIRTR